MQAIILAAGESSRFQPLSEEKHKSLIKIMGKSLIEWTIEAIKRAGIKDIIIVQSPDSDLEKHLGDGSLFEVKLSYVFQKEAKGMGNAIIQAKSLIKEDHFFVLNPYVFKADDFLNLMIEKQKSSNADLVLLGTKTDKPWNYGILELKDDKALSMIEKPEAGKQPSDIKVVGIYLLPKDFFDYYERVGEHDYAYEDALALYMKEKNVRVVITKETTPTLKYPWDLFGVNKMIMDSFIKEQKIDSSVKIAKNVVIEGLVVIEENVTIFENAVIKGPCYIGKGSKIGNNVLIRDYTNLEDGILIGANAEVVRSIFESRTHIHSGFIGDSIIGEDTRIGAGVITANLKIDRQEIKPKVKGKKVETKISSLGVIIGNGTNFGIGVKTMPGTIIGSHSMIGPGSIVMKNVPSDSVFYNKFEEVIRKKK
ncbi:MAG: bifunctional sugar-1-phosphate nucleotidylyltransferase/acetyltransferase [Patescibacteria group bacterium]|nr:bifunctional sugar-1-phosphate nucleotidylyltransferase/acetyltransferase [Patescibacteria group bacterium]